MTRRRRQPPPDGPPAAGAPATDDGLTLIEVMVAMGIMLVFLTMFTSATLQIYQTVNRSEAMTIAQSQLNLAFLRLDREIRYAAAINPPWCRRSSAPAIACTGATPATDRVWFVDYYFTTSAPPDTPAPVCTQLRLRPGPSADLQMRRWTDGDATPPPPFGITIAAGVSADEPFTLARAGEESGVLFHQLRVRLSAAAGRGKDATRRDMALTITALNTSAQTPSSVVCAARTQNL